MCRVQQSARTARFGDTHARKKENFRIFRNQGGEAGCAPGNVPGTVEKSSRAENRGDKKREGRNLPERKDRREKDRKKIPGKKIPAYKLKRYKCRLCGYIYSPLRGEPHHGIPAGTAFEDLPEDYVCPVCGLPGEGQDRQMGF